MTASRNELLVNIGTAAAPDWENIVAKSRVSVDLVHLDWQTATEDNDKGFFVERELDSMTAIRRDQLGAYVSAGRQQ